MDRRSFSLLLPAAVALPGLVLGTPAAGRNVNSSAPPASPLTPPEMAQYEKDAPNRARAARRLRAYPLNNAVQPDFTFFAAPEDRR